MQELFNTVSPEVVYSVFGGVFITVLSNLLKGRLTGWKAQALVLGIATFIGGLYMGFKTFIPEVLQEDIVNFVWGSLTSAVFFYEFIWKNLNLSGK